MNVLLNIIFVILAFSALVIIHEFGHFALAKLNGVKVEEFAIGMGPKLFGIKGEETLYAFRIIPIGGYVKMLGEGEEEEVPIDDERSFSNKSPLRRLSIVAAGPIMNFVLAIVLFAIIGHMRGFSVPIVSEVIPSSPAIKAGIKPGDTITKVNNKKINTWEDVIGQINMSKGSPVDVQLLTKNNEQKSVSIVPIKNSKDGTYMLGICSSIVEKPNFFQSVKYGLQETSSTIKQTFQSLGMIFKGKASKNDFGGPVTILRVTWAVSKAGLMNLVLFSAFISIQLGIFNLLPFPALDGFWIFVSLYQIITKREINKDRIGVINTIGFALLLLLMVVVTIKDVLYPIKL